MSDDHEAFRQQLQKIRKRFVHESKETVQTLRSFWDTPPGPDGREVALQTLFRQAHNFAGSGASFGLELFASSAHLLEFYVQALIDGGGEITKSQAKRICSLLSRLSGALLEERLGEPEIGSYPSLGTVEVGDTTNRRVFLVEDDRQQAGELALQLGFLGYEVFTFNSPDEACAAIGEHDPAVLVMDVVFPEGDLAGPLSLEARQAAGEKPIPVVYISVRRDFKARLAGIRGGGSHYLPKPVDIRKLADVLEPFTAGQIQEPIRVLIIDDDHNEAALHALILERAGMVTASLQRPADALEVLARFRPDLVLLDLYMPDCDGTELAAVLGQHEDFATVPIVFLSSEERFEKKVDAMMAGGEDFLTKPVAPHALTAMVSLRANRARRLGLLDKERASLGRECQRLKNALGHHGLVMYTDPLGRVTYANNKMLALMKHSLAEFLGTDLKAWRKALPSGLWNGLLAGKPWQGKVRHQGGNGDAFWVSLTVVPCFDRNGKIFSHIWLGNDITTFQLQKQELTEARDKAEAALKAKRDILACTTHEMRGALSGLSGLSQLLSEQTPLNPEQQEMVNGIQTSAEHLVNVINQTLDFSKIEAGKLELEHIGFPIRESIEGICEMLAPRAQEKHLHLVVQIHPDVPSHAMGDPLRLRQVLINLVDNAVKFTETGHVLLKIFPISGPSKRLRFEVRDTGIGIPRERQNLLFRFFSQTDASTARQFGGTGLGLAISARLVQAMGGLLAVESVLGAGSCFHFELGLEIPPNTEGPDYEDLATTRVLLVCEHEATAVAIAQQLELFGCRFSMVNDEEKAMRMLTDQLGPCPYDTVLLMLNGRNKATHFKERLKQEWADVSLVLLTTITRLKLARSLATSGGYLLLPVRQERLYQALTNDRGLARGAHTAHHTMEALARKRSRFVILVAEDNPINRRITVNVLRNGGYQCRSVNNGEACLERLADEKIDLVLMDCQMPKMDGFQALTTLRSRGFTHLPVIALSGDLSDEGAAEFDAQLLKPVEPGKLFRTLDQLLLQADSEEMEEEEIRDGTSEPVDLMRFRNITQEDPSLERGLVEMFVLNVTRDITNLGACLRQGNYTSAYQLAHGLKGACLEIGARDLGRIAERLEQLGGEGLMAQALPLLASLQAEFERVGAYLKHYIDDRQKGTDV